MQYENPNPLLDALSRRVLRHLPAAAWRDLLLRPQQEVMQFRPLRGTLLCAAAQVSSWSSGASAQHHLEFLARSHGGELDPCPQSCALVHFEDADAALAMAIELQRLGGELRYQVGIASGECTQALLQIEGATLPVLVGALVDQVEEVTRQATPGSIRLAPDAYRELEPAVQGIAGCMVATEYEDDRVAAASLTLAPRANAFLSTFAGLGLT